ncbi:hypothetical protein [Nonomuraea sp. SYSU D8015]|uniref:hypothetical protein n=1 Tax=Nonomuraea sp. SYSU D8015 TaxID=2593644 RepID=UPI0016613CBA|nr:hypothetical protein [Nonomuraea sp. SYSU D8015]
MTKLIKHLVDDIKTDAGRCLVTDLAALNGEDEAPWDADWLATGNIPGVAVGRNGAELETVRDSPVYVRYELWTGEPPLPEPSWDDSWTGEIYLRSGRIKLQDYYEEGYEQQVFDLGQEDSMWTTRVQHKRYKNDQEPDFPQDIYQVDLYRLQFWPPDSRSR